MAGWILRLYRSGAVPVVKANNPKQFHGMTGRRFLVHAMGVVCAAIFLLPVGQGFAQSATVNADFADRSGGVTIPANMFGFNPVTLQDTTALGLVAQAGFSEVRRTPDLPTIYATTTPDWSSLDWTMQQAQAVGLHPLVVISRTPPWLQPSSNPCDAGTDPSHAPPTDAAQWAQVAASFVAHLDSKFPGLVQDFEIWNEPDQQTSLCAPANTDASRLLLYLNLYAAAASAMRAQAEQDGVAIRIGGPTASDPTLAVAWIVSLLADPQTAPNVDFVSYHIYPAGSKVTQSTNTWSNIYDKVQGVQGALDTYLGIAAAVRAGLQPNASHTPIYITEYNDGAAFVADCCRNDPTYGPLWNSVFLTDVLNSAYAGLPLPERAYYYAGNSAPYFCLVGQVDAAMDCNASAFTPYPQYYAYQLFASPAYLGLKNGGHMANSVSVVGTPNLLATAFYNSSKDIVVIVNPTATVYSGVSVAAKNTGFSAVEASSLLLNSSNPHIAKQAVVSSANAETATVAVPAYSTVAVSWSAGPVQDTPPVASLSVSPTSGTVPLKVTANSSASYDPDGSISSRSVNFGDGSPASTAAVATHTYSQSGNYNVQLVVTDNDGVSSSKTVRVSASAPAAPDFSIAAAPTGSPGKALEYTLTITPDGTLSSPVALSCSEVPQGKACSFSPNMLSVGSKPGHALLSVGPAASASTSVPGASTNFIALMWLFGPAAMLLVEPLRRQKSRKPRRLVLGAMVALFLVFLQMGCGGTGSQSASTSANATSFVVVQASSGSRSHSLTIYLNP
jgi:PKD repeat protein